MTANDSAPLPLEAGAPVPAAANTRLGRVLSFFAIVGIASLMVSIVLTCADILWRRVVGGAFVDTTDLTKLCLVAAASLSIPYGFAVGTHVTVDLLAEKLPAGVQRVLDTGMHLLGAVLIGFLAWVSFQGARLHYGYGDTTLNLRIPMIYYWAIFLFGLALSLLACLVRAFEVSRLPPVNRSPA